MNYFNFHTHTNYCDGSSDPEEYVLEAIKLGFESLGFSGHAPINIDNSYAIRGEDLQEYCDTIRGLKAKYKEINIYLALEADYISNITKDFDTFRRECGLDYIIGSVHLVSNPHKSGLWFIDGSNIETYDDGLFNIFKENIRKGVTSYYHQVNKMITTQHPDIIGHIDKIKMNNKDRYFHLTDKWYKDLVSETLDIVKSNGSIVEVNTRGQYKKRSDETFPGVDILKDLYNMNIPVTISSDAHKPSELALMFDETVALLTEIGFKSAMVYNGTSWIEKGLLN